MAATSNRYENYRTIAQRWMENNDNRKVSMESNEMTRTQVENAMIELSDQIGRLIAREVQSKQQRENMLELINMFTRCAVHLQKLVDTDESIKETDSEQLGPSPSGYKH